MIKPKELKKRCNKLHGVNLDTTSREREYIAQKKAFVALCLKYTDETYKNIGSLIGRDHSTITHYTKTSFFLDDRSVGFDVERKWYATFRDLLTFDKPSGVLQAKILLGTL